MGSGKKKNLQELWLSPRFRCVQLAQRGSGVCRYVESKVGRAAAEGYQLGREGERRTHATEEPGVEDAQRAASREAQRMRPGETTKNARKCRGRRGRRRRVEPAWRKTGKNERQAGGLEPWSTSWARGNMVDRRTVSRSVVTKKNGHGVLSAENAEKRLKELKLRLFVFLLRGICMFASCVSS